MSPWQVVCEDFADLGDGAALVRAAVRLLVASVVGGILGWQRGRTGKSAGMRTHMLVAVGSALFVLIPQQAGMGSDAISRVIQGLVAGIGFLGAGTILKVSEDREIHGLTTAAGIWLTAALGMAAGLGRDGTALLGAVTAFVILSLLTEVERWFTTRGARGSTSSRRRPAERVGEEQD